MDNNELKFTWVDTHLKIVEFIKDKKENQKELITLLKKIGVNRLNDKEKDGAEIPLSVIDPFTFFRYVYKYGSKKRLKLLQNLAKELNIEPIPTDDFGIPSANPQQVWLFPWKWERVNNEIEFLWELFFGIINNNIPNDIFTKILNFKGVGKAKLTEGLFNINPNMYLPINQPVKNYLVEKFNIDVNFNTYTDYKNLLTEVKKNIDKPFYEISYDSWFWNNSQSEINYWIFQGNPKIYNVIEALKDNALITWSVKSFKEKIQKGDKVILWVTGENPGCYALCEVISEVYDGLDDESQMKYYTDKSVNEKSSRVKIKIINNLAAHPIKKEQIDSIDELDNLKVGNQGTNFSATEEEYNAIIELLEKTPSKRYWLYSPGEKARKWDEFYSDGIMAIGWDKLGDLNQYKSKDEIENKLMKIQNKASKKNDALTNYNFKDKISIGDIIIAKRGRTKYLGYGIVKSEYYYDESRDDAYKKCRKVEWLKRGNWKSDFPIVLKTLTDITKYPEYVEELIKLIGIDEKSLGKLHMKTNENNFPLNTIFYGPPGTGKTFKLKNEYFDLFTSTKTTESKEQFLSVLINKYTWWQLIGTVLLDLGYSSLQEIYNHELLATAIRQSKNNKDPKATIRQSLQVHTIEGCEYINYKQRFYPQFVNKDKNSKWGIEEELAKADAPEIFDILNEYKNFNPKDIYKKRYVFTTFHQSYSYEEFIEGIKPVLIENELGEDSNNIISYEVVDGIFKNIAREAEEDPENNYAIFIDEINRGNIASIFGELITLIEEDKRIGCKNYISTTLPYSKKEFGIPKNLYIIGTMNTADRSVEALDTALRRRFSFIEMNPKPEILSDLDYICKGLDLEKLLKAINGRIEKLLDKDYCIGHSYFMTIINKQEPTNELRDIFSNKILPLLQEYFYGDWGKIQLVLGEKFVEKKSDKVVFLNSNGINDIEEYEEKNIYQFTESANWTIDTFKSIYESSKQE